MTQPDNATGIDSPRRATWAAVWVVVALLTLAAVWLYWQLVPADLGPAQPISFSHRFHVTTKGLSCLWCHPPDIGR